MWTLFTTLGQLEGGTIWRESLWTLSDLGAFHMVCEPLQLMEALMCDPMDVLGLNSYQFRYHYDYKISCMVH